MRLLGTSKVSTDNKITVVKEAAELFELVEGDLLAFYEYEKNIILKKASFRGVSEIFSAFELLKKKYDNLQKPDKIDIPRLKNSMDTLLTIETKLDKKDVQDIINKYFNTRGWE